MATVGKSWGLLLLPSNIAQLLSVVKLRRKNWGEVGSFGLTASSADKTPAEEKACRDAGGLDREELTFVL